MGLGIWDDKHLSHVPGTADILDDEQQRQDANRSHLKHDTSGPTPILLVPQPSDDPNDPLNWPKWKKDCILLILCVTAVLCTTVGPILAPCTFTMVLEFGISITQGALLTGWVLCGCGVSGVIIVPTARVWGKRHLYLLGAIFTVFSCAWAGASAGHYRSILWSRIFQGVGLAPFESLVGATVGDMYFVHERGVRMAITSVSLFGGAFLTPVISGKIAESINWQWTFNFISIFTGCAIPFVFFFVPETAYRRDTRLDIDIRGDLSQDTLAGADPALERAKAAGAADAEKAAPTATQFRGSMSSGAPVFVPPKKSYWRTLALFDGRKTDEHFWKLLLRPFPLFVQPGVVWACLVQGVIIGWTVFIGVIFGVMFNGPPLFYAEVTVGYMYAGAFIGSMVGLLISGLSADTICRLMTRLNGGRYEPEFRILLVIPMLIFSGIGLFGLGYTTSDALKYGIYPNVVFFGFVTCGMVIGAVASCSYVIDAHRDIAIENFTCLLIFKNMFSFALTYKAWDWIVLSGSKHVFTYCGIAQVCVCALSIPMYIFGKKNRSFFYRHDILRACGLR